MAEQQLHCFEAQRQGRTALLRGALSLLVFLALLPDAATQTQSKTAQGQKTFATPEEAVKALVSAVKSKNRAKIFAVVGQEMRGTMTTGNKLLDKMNSAQFLEAVHVTSMATDKEDPKRKFVYFGKQKWPFPAPLVKEGSAWRFDGAAGREEVTNRRIGGNELQAIQLCHGYVEAQREYALKDRDGDGTLEFAQRILSTPGTKDGLYWSSDNDEDPSPIGPLFGNVTTPSSINRDPVGGYYFRILTAQGEHAQDGAQDYIINGHMTGGFALIAWPSRYGKTGINTFLINQLGVIYQKDLGPDTETTVQAMIAFDPDDTWTRLGD